MTPTWQTFKKYTVDVLCESSLDVHTDQTVPRFSKVRRRILGRLYILGKSYERRRLRKQLGKCQFCIYLLTVCLCVCVRVSCQSEWFPCVQWQTLNKTSRYFHISYSDTASNEYACMCVSSSITFLFTSLLFYLSCLTFCNVSVTGCCTTHVKCLWLSLYLCECVCMSVCLYVSLPVSVSLCLSVSVSVCLCVYLCMCMYASVSVSACVCVCLCMSVCVCLSMCV